MTMQADPITPDPGGTIDARRQAWLEARRKVYTGTDVAKILGVSKFGAPIDVWLDKRGLAEPDPDTAPKRSGRAFERAILTMYSEETGHPIEFADSYTLVTCPAFPLLGATLDARRQDTDLRPVDAKNVRYRDEQWGDAGTDQMPFYYLTQLAAQMAVTTTPAADLAVVFSGQDFATYTAEHDPDLEDRIKNEISRFHAHHVLADIPPEVDGSEGWRELLKRTRQASDTILDSTQEIDAWAAQLKLARSVIEAGELDELEAQNHIKAFIGEHAGVKGPWGRISYKQNKDSKRLDADAYIEELERLLYRLAALEEHDALRAELAIVRAQLTSIRPGARPFKPTFKD